MMQRNPLQWPVTGDIFKTAEWSLRVIRSTSYKVDLHADPIDGNTREPYEIYTTIAAFRRWAKTHSAVVVSQSAKLRGLP